MLGLITFILGIASIQARIFNNPVLGSGDYRDPGAIKVDGIYYMTTSIVNYTQPEKFEIHQSTDLINWNLAGYIFDETNVPTWANKDSPFMGAKIYKIGNNYNVYFSAYHNSTGKSSIGVAIATHPLGPYVATDRPLLTDAVHYLYYPAIANDNGTLHLMWRDDLTINGRQLNSNGLHFTSDQAIELLSYTITWEDYFLAAPWHIHRGDYHYIMYTANGLCELQGIGVARSHNVLGPYEKLNNPILESNKYFLDPSYNSLIRDLDDQNEVIVFQTHRASVTCNQGPTVIAMASLGWNADNWPYIYDY